MKTLTSIDSYEAIIRDARSRFDLRANALSAQSGPEATALFLVYFCSQGVAMTKPVPDWIRRAGERSRDQGFTELGNHLIAHAGHETGHHEMMSRDVTSLVGYWNRRFASELDASRFLSASPAPGVEHYHGLHERYIQSSTPYCQIAIEYEIERLSIVHGPRLFGHCARVLGAEVLRCLSFLDEHIALDSGHTSLNARLLDAFLQRHSDSLEPLVRAGAEALDAYASFLEDCWKLAKETLASLSMESHLVHLPSPIEI